ncbi:hypothetical protein DL95DRAFT_528881 [Leptodontidium sp. 2 PMI_412]|nr:hypothetical protein DL95DRAFT_528881 [Leptodontidium sp. 2 PMI_412]
MFPPIPLGSTVLVTGINGYVGSHVADQLLLAGYKVRGTARDPQKAAGLVALWDGKYGKNKVEVITVKNMVVAGAFDEAVKGVTGIAHVASNMSYSPDPNAVIPEVLAGIRSIIDSAILSPSVKRIVYTSSGSAEAWAPPPYNNDRAFSVYAASKAESEKLLFEYAKEKKVSFNVASVVPGINFGKILDHNISASSGDMLKQFIDGKATALNALLPHWFVDVQDTARLHVAALMYPGVQNERVFAFAGAFGYNDLVRGLRKVLPDKEVPQELADEKRDLTTFPIERGAELLRAMGRPGWTSLEYSLRLNVEEL